jgi:glycine hydroxymethyltransferase
MGEAEMRQVADLIARAVKTDDEAAHRAIKAEVGALVSAFPAYPRG